MKRKIAVPVDSGPQVHINTGDIPVYLATNLAQSLFEAIQRDFQRPEVQEEYERWKAARAAAARA